MPSSTPTLRAAPRRPAAPDRAPGLRRARPPRLPPRPRGQQGGAARHGLGRPLRQRVRPDQPDQDRPPAVGDDGTREAMIATAHGRGYRLVVPVRRAGEPTGGRARGLHRAHEVQPVALLERDAPLRSSIGPSARLEPARGGWSGWPAKPASGSRRSFAASPTRLPTRPGSPPVPTTSRRRGRSARSGTSSTGSRSTAGRPRGRRQRDQLSRVLGALGAERGCVVVIEDLHWADDARSTWSASSRGGLGSCRWSSC